MSTRCRAACVVLAVGLARPTLALAQEKESSPSKVMAALSPDSRVRAIGREARRVLERAITCSPTVARMVLALQPSDLVVVVETTLLSRNVSGETRLVAAAAVVRYVRIRLGVPSLFSDLIAVFGHELHHAMELASAPTVRDEASQRGHYLRIGYARMRGGYFETEGAIETGRDVAREVEGCSALR